MTRAHRPLFGERDPDESDAPRWHVERVTIDDEPDDGLAPGVIGTPVVVTVDPADVEAPAPLAPLEALPEPDVYAPPPVLPRPPCAPPPRTGARVEVWHGQPMTPLVRGTCIVAALTDETRDPIWWRSALPGVGFEITIWPDGAPLEGQKHAPKEILGPFGPDQIIREPVQRIDVQLPDGRVRSMPVTMIGGQPRIILSAVDVMPAPLTEKLGMPPRLRERMKT